MNEIHNLYGFAIQKNLKRDPNYINHINHQILDAISQYIDDALNISGSADIYNTDGVNIGLNIAIRENENVYDPHEEILRVKINSVNIREFETYFISRMEELKFHNPEDKATFKERLQILFKGSISGGKMHIREVEK